jgi:transposase
MHLRINSTKRGGQTYRYVQIVQSVRDNNGKSTTRVVKHLGALPPEVIDALRVALRAGQHGERIFAEEEVSALLGSHSLASRQFLDLAVLVECWRSHNMKSVLGDVSVDMAMSFEQVVLCLVIQRCCAPGSKLGATRWVPRTALPELLGFEPRLFNNSRIHRTLENLYEVTPALQDRLTRNYLRQGREFGVMFMDVTDTYFEGIGCPLAEQTKTKTEMPNKRCIAIVMLVDKHGYPLRWELVGGKTKDWTAMQGMLQQLKGVPWIEKTPIVFDRAMGNRSTVKELKEAGLWFLTAAHRTAIESYTCDIPAVPFAELQPEGTSESYQKNIEMVAQVAREAGFEEVDSRLFVKDLGVAEISPPDRAARYSPREGWRGQPNKLAENLKLAGQIQQMRDKEGKRLTQPAIAKRLGLTLSKVSRAERLRRLSSEIQNEILKEGPRFVVPEIEIRSLLKLSFEEQNKRFTALRAKHKGIKDGLKEALKQQSPKEDNPLKLRLVAYFNPQLFVDTRLRTAAHCEQLLQHATAFNAELAAAKKSRDRDPTYRRFVRELERLSYLDTFDINLESIELTTATGRVINSFKGEFVRNEAVWKRRRKYDGFVLLLAHPDIPHNAVELANYYRGKDVVEKGFQTIKSFVQLRPVYHYTDPKVQAHVTICMLALMLMRTLRQRLKLAGLDLTETSALELLADCRLEERASTNGTTINHSTKLNQEQGRILTKLNLEYLVDPKRTIPAMRTK